VIGVCFSNRSLVHLKQGNIQAALDDAKQAVCFAPDYSKAHHRLGKSLRALGREDEATTALQKANLIGKMGLTHKQALDRIRKVKAAAVRKERKQQKAKAGLDKKPLSANQKKYNRYSNICVFLVLVCVLCVSALYECAHARVLVCFMVCVCVGVCVFVLRAL
jgi:tetratricopeptide (TPR) repeat protein